MIKKSKFFIHIFNFIIFKNFDISFSLLILLKKKYENFEKVK